MATLDYANEKFGDAMDYMAASAEPLAERLRNAYVDCGVMRITELPEQVDPELRARLARLHEAFERFDAGDEGIVAATMQLSTDAELEDLARLVVDVARRIEAAIEDLPDVE